MDRRLRVLCFFILAVGGIPRVTSAQVSVSVGGGSVPPGDPYVLELCGGWPGEYWFYDGEEEFFDSPSLSASSLLNIGRSNCRKCRSLGGAI
jgi:hypothetical protein